LVNKQNWTRIPKNNECVAGTSKEQQKGQQVFEWMPIAKGEHSVKILSVDRAQRTATKKMSGYTKMTVWELSL
jgi:hypothetical protein